ncbi:molybdenum cofactor biosynthesis protein MoaE [Paraburkholderia sp. JPY419]|uniref:molybdenum cofactor biosynthesis protein MoaE n=1 Tax=Paraburkholderia sp. JPY419 TaxID=667660 RepID=UPI003D1A5448
MSALIPASSVQPSTRYSHSDDEHATAGAGIAAGFEVRVQQQPIAVQTEIAPIMRNPDVGAIVNFIGVVRNNGDSDDVVALELEHYPGMTEQSLWGIVEEAIARWKVDAVKVVHRTGRIMLGDAVVLVVVAAPHRAAAFEACEFVMDFLKMHAPFWKKEHRRDGGSDWVEARRSDEQAMLRWG